MNKRKNVLIIGAIVLAALLLLAAGAFLRPSGGGSVLITVDGREYARAKLGPYREITIDLGEGESNVVVIDGQRVFMKSSTCRDGLCVEQGEVTPENIRFRALGADIICLPHRVVVTLISDNAGTDLPDV